MHDVIVVGAGPSGSTTAYLCAKSGFNVLLLDKKFPRRKICGGSISPKSIKLLEKLKFNLNDAPKNWFSKIKLFSYDGSSADLPLPESMKGYVTDRFTFDAALVNAAIDNGTNFYSNAKCVDVIKENGFIKGVTVRRDGNPETLYGKIVVAADGANSIIMSKLGLLNHSPETTAICMRAIYSNVENLSDSIEFHCNSFAPEGFGWVFPCGNGQANIGIGGSVAKYQQRNLSIPKAFEWFTKVYPIVSKFLKDAKIIAEPAGFPLNSSIPQKTYGNGFIAVGEASGFCNSLSGEGIYYAIKSGELAARTIIESLSSEQYPHCAAPNNLDKYEILWKKEFGDELKRATKLRKLTNENEEKTKIIIDACIKNAKWREFVTNALIGLVPYGKTFYYILKHPSFLKYYLQLKFTSS
ncbi:MAG: NAD(P)/FAD-dependent oxidoreductase [Euryarchaeota archaeon]|nr:NAD(P)/FAD-dependent oxidoreductase [Euryarchaeota archaeon]